jgi:hypothetical protein
LRINNNILKELETRNDSLYSPTKDVSTLFACSAIFSAAIQNGAFISGALILTCVGRVRTTFQNSLCLLEFRPVVILRASLRVSLQGLALIPSNCAIVSP